MNWSLMLSLVVTALVAVAGWWAVHSFASKRDRLNKRRDIRVQYLIEAYRKLANASQRSPSPEYFRDMEAAIADIQLFGSDAQVSAVKAFTDEFAKYGRASLDALLTSLRDDLRGELDLSRIDGTVRWFRPEGAP